MAEREHATAKVTAWLDVRAPLRCVAAKVAVWLGARRCTAPQPAALGRLFHSWALLTRWSSHCFARRATLWLSLSASQGASVVA